MYTVAIIQIIIHTIILHIVKHRDVELGEYLFAA